MSSPLVSGSAPPLPPRYVDYARVSTEQQAAKELSIPAQQREIRAYAAAQKHAHGTGWILADSFADAGISGTTMDRPGLQSLLAAARARLFDILLVHKMDRLSREEIDYLLIKAELKRFGIAIVSVTEPFAGGSHPMDEMMETLARGFNKLYVSNLRREVKKGMREMAEKGRQNGAPPYGYRYADLSKRGSGWEIDPDAAPWLGRLFERFAEGDLSMVEMTRWANERGVPLPHSRFARRRTASWRAVTLRRIFINRAYLGEIQWTPDGVLTAKDDPAKLSRHGSGIWRVGKHPPLINPDTFGAVQDIMRLRGRPGNAVRRRDNATGNYTLLGGGLLRCPLCAEAGFDTAMLLWSSSLRPLADGSVRRYTFYNCCSRQQRKVAEKMGGEWLGPVCPGFSTSEEKVMQMLRAALEDIGQQAEMTSKQPAPSKKAPIRARIETAPLTETPDSLRRELAQAAALRLRYQEMAAKGHMTDDELGGQLASLTARRTALEERLAAVLIAPPPAQGIAPETAQGLLAVLGADLPGVVKRDKLRSVIEKIIPWKDKTGITIQARPCRE